MEKLYIIPCRKPTEDTDVLEAKVSKPDKAKGIPKRFLVNKLNYINFQDRTILINLKHTKYGSTFSLTARPLPCVGDKLDCVWSEPADPWILKSHTFQNLLITDGKKCLLVNPEVISINDQGISFLLPEICNEINSRITKRYPSIGIQATITQSSAVLKGTLLDSSPTSFRTKVTSSSPQAFQWINSTSPVSLHLHSGHELLYSGECKIVKQSFDQENGSFVLVPVSNRIQRYRPKQFRSTRHTLVPSPNMVFVHPLTGRNVSLKTIDISGSGFSVEESSGNSQLLAGMIIPELDLSFAQSFRIKCRAQVVYRNTSGEKVKDGTVRCGLAILDMEIDDHVRLLSLLQQADNRNSYVCTSVDMDALWNFFFETGFIYPEKYAAFQFNKLEIKKVYEKLYNHNPAIARHFIYQEKGDILGHMSMVRLYENSWMIHHHAANKSESMKAGLMVLKQISCYLNDLYHLYSAHLKYIFYYFRPDNKFPNRVFGGFANDINDLQGCSLDKFTYFRYRKTELVQEVMPKTWTLSEIQSGDYDELKRFYNHASGGLMIDAFDLHPRTGSLDGVSEEYRRLGLKKEKYLYSLAEKGELKAIIMANVTDIGLNMADLTNCVTVMVIDESTPVNIIESALCRVAGEYEHQEMPVLMYPVSYADTHSLPVEKVYTLCIMNLQYTDKFIKFCDDGFRFVQNSALGRDDSQLPGINN